MKVAFYAPMKPPDGAKPSGDRTIGQLLLAALAAVGADARVVSQLRTWSDRPDPRRLVQFAAGGGAVACALADQYRVARDGAWRPDIWLTYHCYYKAPDFIGPAVADALGMPYVIVEASYSARRAADDWRDWTRAARAAIEQADAILSFTERDRHGLAPIAAAERLHILRPFLDVSAHPPPPARPRPGLSAVRLVTVAMMRPGAKLASYRLLADCLARLKDRDWTLDVIGDGAARPIVEAAFRPLPADRIRWHGALAHDAIGGHLRAADVFLWPGLDEAFGMAFLEAQASGLPVVACRTAGVPEVVRDGTTGLLSATTDAAALAGVLARLIDDGDLRRSLAGNARAGILAHHSLDAASATLSRVLSGLVARP